MTFIEEFDIIKSKFKNVKKSALRNEFAIEVTMTDEDCGGTFYIANINGYFDVQPYNYFDSTVRISCGAQKFIDLIEKKIGFNEAVSDEAIKVDGNAEHAMLLSDILKKTPVRTAVKKAAAKKTKSSPAKKAERKKPDIKKTEGKETAEKKAFEETKRKEIETVQSEKKEDK